MTESTLAIFADLKEGRVQLDAQGVGVYVAGVLSLAALGCVCALLWPARRELIPLLRTIANRTFDAPRLT
jgi:hypothetical protein